jgi:hypothetical protein
MIIIQPHSFPAPACIIALTLINAAAHPSSAEHPPCLASICTFALPLIFAPNEATIVSNTIGVLCGRAMFCVLLDFSSYDMTCACG